MSVSFHNQMGSVKKTVCLQPFSIPQDTSGSKLMLDCVLRRLAVPYRTYPFVFWLIYINNI